MRKNDSTLSAHLMDGSRVPVVVPTRYYAYASDGKKFSTAAMVEFISACGFDGMDVSFDLYTDLGNPLCYEDDIYSLLSSLGNMANKKGLSLPSCHLPFYMPSPDDTSAMKPYLRSLREGILAAAYLHIPVAVIHPIVRHSSLCNYVKWREENIAYLSPLRELAETKGVTLAIENMTGIPYPNKPKELVFGSRAKDIRLLADKLDCGICWDTGHAHLTGLCQSAELHTVGERLRMLHIHDNDAQNDAHLIPMTATEGGVDFADFAQGLSAVGFGSMAWRCLNLEIKTSHLPSDTQVRAAYAAKTWVAAKRLAEMI